MITTSQAHIDLLNSRNFCSVDLYEFSFLDGSKLRFASGGLSVSYGGNTYQGGGPLIERDSVRVSRGLDADDLKLTVRPKDDDTLFGLPWREACANGALDGASVSLYRAHCAEPGGAIVGAVLRFSGPVDGVEIEQDIGITVKSMLYRLSRVFPRAVFQPACDRTIFDGGCGLPRSAYQITGALQAGSSDIKLLTGLTQDAGYFDGGELLFTSGLNAGARRTVKTHIANGVLGLAYPLPREVAVGDSFVIVPGCDGTYARCQKYNNTSRFRGQPFVPAPETAY